MGGDTFKIQSLIDPLRAKLEQVMERLGVRREGPQVSPHPVIHNPHACEGTPDSSSPLKSAVPEAREKIVDLIDLNEEEDSLWVFSRTCMSSGCCVECGVAACSIHASSSDFVPILISLFVFMLMLALFDFVSNSSIPHYCDIISSFVLCMNPCLHAVLLCNIQTTC